MGIESNAVRHLLLRPRFMEPFPSARERYSDGWNRVFVKPKKRKVRRFRYRTVFPAHDDGGW